MQFGQQLQLLDALQTDYLVVVQFHLSELFERDDRDYAFDLVVPEVHYFHRGKTTLFDFCDVFELVII